MPQLLQDVVGVVGFRRPLRQIPRRRNMKFPVRRQWLSEESPMLAISSTFTTEVSALGGLCMSLCMSIARMNRGRARAKRD